MNTLSIPVVAMASISFYVGLYHLLIYFRRRKNRENLTFALLCFAIVFYDAFCVGLYNATSVAEGAQWQRAQFSALAFFLPAFLWFVADYTQQKPGFLTYLFSALYLAALIVQLFDRSSLTFPTDQPAIKEIRLPYVEPITYYETSLGPLTTAESLLGVAASTYILIMALQYFRRGYRRQAMPLILAIGLMYAAAFHDTFVSNGVYEAVYLVEYSYLAMILMMAYSLSNTIVEAALAKEELKKSEERFRGLVETTSDWVWEVDAAGIYTYASPKVRDLLGYEPAEILGRTPFEIMPPNEAERVSAMFQSIREQQKAFENLENIACAKDGQLVVLETSGVPFFDEQGRLAGYRGIDRDISQRKQVEEALRESEQKFRLFVEQSSDGLVFTDEHGSIIEWNSAQERLTGLSRRLIIGMPLWEMQEGLSPDHLTTPGLRNELKRKIAPALETGQAEFLDKPLEIALLRRDGTRVVAQQMTFSIRTNQGYRLGSIIRDITQLKQAEEELRASEARYRTLVEVSPIATWITKGHVITYVNPAALRILGASRPEQVIGKESLNFIHPDYHAVVLERTRQMLENGGVAPLLEEKYVQLDGSIVDVEVIATPFTTSGDPIIQVFFQDVTKRKQAERALRASEARHRALVESQIDLVSRYLPDTTLTFVNDAYCKFFGKTREELIGQSYLALIAPEFREQDAAVTRKQAQEKGTATGEDINYRFDGEKRWIQWVVKCITDDHGQVIELQSVGRDITPLKQAEAERERLIAELESKNTELERFTYTVSHDLKAPLITIRGFLGFIEPDARAGNLERLKQDMQRIIAASDKMQRLLDELLELSRIGRLMNVPSQIVLADLVQEAVKLVEGRLQERKVEVKIQENLPVLFGDARRLLEVFQNLLDNAVKFMGEQSRPVIEIGSRGAENGVPLLFVRDNGMGIAPAFHERIFGLFNKLDPSAEGTGVGLAIVKRIIELHGGRIWVESQEGQGATFYFTVAKGPQAPDAEPVGTGQR